MTWPHFFRVALSQLRLLIAVQNGRLIAEAKRGMLVKGPMNKGIKVLLGNILHQVSADLHLQLEGSPIKQCSEAKQARRGAAVITAAGDPGSPTPPLCCANNMPDPFEEERLLCRKRLVWRSMYREWGSENRSLTSSAFKTRRIGSVGLPRGCHGL